METLIDTLFGNVWAAAALVALGTLIAAWVVEALVIGFLRRLAGKTKTDLDDQVLDLLKRPTFISFLLVGFDRALHLLDLGQVAAGVTRATFYTIAIVLWTVTLLRLSTLVLRQAARRAKEGSVLQARTLPLFDILSKSAVLAGAIYLGMVAWDIDVGAWLASAGVVGIAVGFAARDSLANYFAGVFIIADAPYKLNDIVILDDGTRGRVSEIGLRSTRIHTKDEIEINIPNSVLGNMKIENRSAGPIPAERLAVDVGVAYGSDVDRVIEVLEGCAADIEGVERDLPAVARFVAFGASSLDFKVFVWSQPADAEVVSHELHRRIYKALQREAIEIPFPQTDLHVKELPPREAA